MGKFNLTRAELNKGYELAFFVLSDSEIAESVTRDALNRLETQLRVQTKRSYYSRQTYFYKVTWDSYSLFKLLILQLCEPHEKKMERDFKRRAAALPEETMIIHYVKAILVNTMLNNSFYVNVGISRLLYDYSFDEAATTYGWLFSDDRGYKDSVAYRKIKKRLMDRLRGRFRDFLTSLNEPQGTHLVTGSNSRDRADLVERCLKLMMPETIECLTQETLEKGTIFQEKTGAGKGTRPEHNIEQARIHSLVCPECFARLHRALRQALPRERLTLPKFVLADATE